MACAFGIVASFTLGLVGQTYPSLIPLIVFLVTMVSAQVVRYFSIGAPGFFFFTFAMILGTYIPFEIKDYPAAIGLVALGTMLANVMVLLYSLSVIYIFKHPPKPIAKMGEFGFGVIIIDPIIIAFFVSASLCASSDNPLIFCSSVETLTYNATLVIIGNSFFSHIVLRDIVK